LPPLCGARLVRAKENKSTIPSLRSSLKMIDNYHDCELLNRGYTSK
jgi:hypothetical protein